jgi:hypothetical protein
MWSKLFKVKISSIVSFGEQSFGNDGKYYLERKVLVMMMASISYISQKNSQ